MNDTIEKRLSDLGVTLPVAAAPAANYVPYRASGKLLFTAGQLPLKDGKLSGHGLLGRDVERRPARKRQNTAPSTYWRRPRQHSATRKDPPDRQDHGLRRLRARLHRTASCRQRRVRFPGRGPRRAGKHARSAVGTASLPLNAAVEIEAVIEVA